MLNSEGANTPMGIYVNGPSQLVSLVYRPGEINLLYS